MAPSSSAGSAAPSASTWPHCRRSSMISSRRPSPRSSAASRASSQSRSCFHRLDMASRRPRPASSSPRTCAASSSIFCSRVFRDLFSDRSCLASCLCLAVSPLALAASACSSPRAARASSSARRRRAPPSAAWSCTSSSCRRRSSTSAPCALARSSASCAFAKAAFFWSCSWAMDLRQRRADWTSPLRSFSVSSSQAWNSAWTCASSARSRSSRPATAAPSPAPRMSSTRSIIVAASSPSSASSASSSPALTSSASSCCALDMITFVTMRRARLSTRGRRSSPNFVCSASFNSRRRVFFRSTLSKKVFTKSSTSALDGPTS
mmetsp:Transcript_88167/g.249822  ORF Transcript_88167/g.249822 Transcript_88167/m.249822 type:complete len:321 (+) Transcript_88167:321-1283(+)